MAYITKDEVKKYLGVNWAVGLDSFIDGIISSCEKYVENFCGDDKFGRRVFEAPESDVDVTKYFDGNGETRLYIGDIRELTTLIVDGTTLTVDEDFYLYPLNASDEGRPYERIELIQPSTRLNLNSRLQSSAPYIFDEGQRLVQIDGKWGFSDTAPDDIKLAVMKLVGGVIKENIGDNDLREVTQESLGEYSASFAKIKDTANRLGMSSMLAEYKRAKRGRSTVIKV